MYKIQNMKYSQLESTTIPVLRSLKIQKVKLLNCLM